MRTTFSAVAAFAAIAGAQSSTSIDIDAISVAVPTSVFVLPVVYVTAEGAPTLTATTLAATAVPSSDSKATAVFDSAADVTAAIVSASVAAASETAVVKRDGTCIQQPLSPLTHLTVPDTPAAFAADPWYGVQAVAAVLPNGWVQTFSNLTASNSADQYVGFTLMNSYDVAGCGAKCSATSGCNSFNIYFERDPQYDPSIAACNNPASTVNVKCVMWGSAVTAANANNFGQMRDGFQVAVAGSNGYISAPFAAQLAAKATATSSSSSAAASATDAAGNIYTIYYSSDSNQGAYSNTQAANSYTDCMIACDNAASSGCVAFTYVGGNNGVGSGTCWLKSQLGSPTSAGTNVLSGVRSGKAVTSSSSSVVSTTFSGSSSSAVSTSSTASKTSTSSSSSSFIPTTSSSSSSVVPTTSSTSSVATTMSTVTKSASTTSSAGSTSSSTSKTSSAPTTLSTAFYIVPYSGYYAKVAPGANAAVSGSSQSSATKFQIDSATGYLIEATGNVGYAASMPQGINVNQALVFNPTGTASNNYLQCSIDNNAGYLVCTAGGQFQIAYACPSDNWNTLYFGPSIPYSAGCNWVGLYRQSA